MARSGDITVNAFPPGKTEHLSITFWYIGRLGNVLLQVVNGVHYGKLTKSRVTAHAFGCLPKSQWDFTEGNPTVASVRQCTIRHLNFPSLAPYAPTVAEKRIAAIRHVRHRLRLPAVDVRPNTLILSVRSGDIMDPKVAHPHYVQPPLAFYERAMADAKAADAIILTEPDRVSPVADALAQRYELRIHDGDITWAFAACLQAEHLCHGYTSFIYMAAWLSQAVRHVYTPAGQWSFWVTRQNMTRLRLADIQWCRLHSYDLPGYVPRGAWTASPEQVAGLLSYPYSQVTPEKSSA